MLHKVVHDDWGAYQALSWQDLPFGHSARDVVNHSKEAKNIFGRHTNAIEAVWSSLKRWLRARYGGKIPSGSPTLELAIAEFAWRHRLGEGGEIPAWIALLRRRAGKF